MSFMPVQSPSRWLDYHVLAPGACVAGARYGLTIGRVTVQAGAPHFPYAEILQFPYPVAATLFQLLSTCILLLIAKLVTSKLPMWRQLLGQFPKDSTNFHLGDVNQLNEAHASSSDDPNSASMSKQPDRIVFKTLILGIAVAADAVLGTYILSFAPLEIYIMSQGLVLPFALVLSRFMLDKDDLSFGIVLRFMILSVGVMLAASRPVLPLSWRVVCISVLFSVSATLWPLQFQRIRQVLTSRKSQYQPLGTESGNDMHPSDIKSRPQGPDLWRILQATCLLSLLFLLPILLLSGELGYISRNCYFLGSPQFWILMSLNGLFRFVLILSSALFVRETSAFDVMFFLVLVNVSQVPVLTYSKLLLLQWLGLGICTVTGFSFYWTHPVAQIIPLHRTESYNWFRQTRKLFPRINRTVIAVLAIILITFGFLVQNLYNEDSGEVWRNVSPITPNGDRPIPNILHGMDDYLGPRPHFDTVADIALLIKECRGTYEGMENMRNVFNCLQCLATKQDDYFKPPQGRKLEELPSFGNMISGNKEKRSAVFEYGERNLGDSCEGPVVLYHFWWTGLPTWRTELFIKAYLFTQNLACSKLWIWVNSDHDPRAMQKWLLDSHFLRFMPFVERGDIVVKEWKFPARVPLSREIDELDRARYYQSPSKPKDAEKVHVADYVTKDPSEQEWLEIYEDTTQLTYFTVASSDAARLIILHLHGGVYLDVDMILLRDLRPLILSNLPFAERWGAHAQPELYNNAIVALPANSSISSYILRGGTRMGLVYHFMAIGRMLVAEGRDGKDGRGLLKLETGFFDPIWADADALREGRCTVPCLNSFESVFKSAPVPNEWESFDGQPIPGSGDGNNRTLENFYRGAFAYHIHNQWDARYERGSWIDVICTAHDEFFAAQRVNPYGEEWNGPPIANYGA